MEKALLIDYVTGERIEGSLKDISNEARERKNEDYGNQNVVLGRDFINNHTCYFLKEYTRELDKLQLEKDVNNYFQEV
jgi:hypothetical protein